MMVNNNLSVLPFYSNIEWQKHNLPYSYGSFFPLVTDSNMILPFQIVRETKPDPITNIQLCRPDGSVVDSMLIKMQETGLKLVRFEDKGYDIILYPSRFPFGVRYPEGFYYLRITDGADIWYSEVFVYVNDTSGYLKLQWWNRCALEMNKASILYNENGFRNYMYLFSEIARPEYPYEEEGDMRDGVFFPKKQLSWKRYNFVFLATEPMLDVLRLVALADVVRIRNRSRIYEPKNINITPDDWVTGDISSVTAEFITDEVIKKLPVDCPEIYCGDFNDDYNDDFDNCGSNPPEPVLCIKPESVSISGEFSPTVGQTQVYTLNKVGGNAQNTVHWTVTGGEIQGANNGNTVTVKWGNTPGNYSVFVSVFCTDQPGEISSLQPITVTAAVCVNPTGITITGPTTATVGVPVIYNSVKTGGNSLNSYMWEVSYGGSINGLNNSSSVSITWHDEGEGTVTLYCSCSGNPPVVDTHNTTASNPIPGALFRVPTHPQPSGNNRTNITAFPNHTNHNKMIMIWGDGAGLWANEEVNGSGKLIFFDKGVTNIFDISAFARSKWEPKNIYLYNQAYYMFNTSCQDCVNAGITGVVGGIDYGDIAGVIAGGDMWNTNIPYYLVTVEGMIEIGKRMNWGTSNSIDDPAWNIDGNQCVLMLDEESMTHYAWPGGDHDSMMGYLTQGIMEVAGPNKRVFWYGHPISWAFNQMRFHKAPSGWGWENDTIQGLFQPSNVLKGSPGWLAVKWYLDKLGAYQKVPWLSEFELYEKDGFGEIIIESGRRKFRDDFDYIISIYEKNETIYKEPHDWQKWAGTRNDGSHFYGWQPEWGAYDSIEMTNNLPSGWDWFDFARPNRSEWLPETRYWVEGVYMQANGAVTSMLMHNYREKGVWDAQSIVEQYVQYHEFRTKTEPWTADGNALEVREIGPDGIFYNMIMLAYSGCYAFSSWQDGGSTVPRPSKPGQLWGADDFYGRDESRLAAYQEAYKELQGVDPALFKFVQFYYPFKGETNCEPVSMGIYYGTRFYYCFVDPNLEVDEVKNFTLKAGATTFNLTATGHEFYLGNFDVPAGLDVEDFELIYETIYEVEIHVNGKITDDFTEHYI